MTLTLILTRHAKSAWDDPALDDFDRPLNDRGRASARRIGAWLAREAYVPGEVILSGARRTVETWNGIAPAFGGAAPAPRVDPSLYHAAPNAILAALGRGTAGVLMLIGHNPGIAEAASRLVVAPPDHPRFHDYPTAATAVIGFDAGDWQAVDWGGGRVRAFTVPRDLDD